MKCPENEVQQESKEPGLSKNQLKKIKKKENAAKYRDLRRQRKKAKKAELKQQAEERGLTVNELRLELGMPRQAMAGLTRTAIRRREELNVIPAVRDIDVVFDCSFEPQMTDAEVTSLGNQLRYSYSRNRRSPRPVRVGVCGGLAHGSRLQAFATTAREFSGAFGLEARPFEEVFDPSRIVYLCAEAEEPLDALREGEVYVIGGLVDHNRLKGACHARALALGVRTARLPLQEHVNLRSRKVLTTFHCLELLLTHSENGEDWRAAIDQVIPARKWKENQPKKKKERKEEEEDQAAT